MSKPFRFWYAAASSVALLAFLGHSSAHYFFYIDEGRFSSERRALVSTMKAYVAEPILGASAWRFMQMYSVSFSFLVLFSGLMNWLLLRSGLPGDFMKKAALFNLLFRNGAFLVFTGLHPVIQPIVISASSALLFGVALLRSMATTTHPTD